MTKPSKKSGKKSTESAVANPAAQVDDSTLIDLEKQFFCDLGFLVDKVFDATDDFLFASTALGNNASVLNSLRELRNKKIFFLNRLSSSLLNALKADWIELARSDSVPNSMGKPSTDSTPCDESKQHNGSLFDFIENDLFNENVIRRAMDVYAPMFEQGDLAKAGFEELSEEEMCKIHRRFFCIVIDAMNHAREDLNLTQEATLIFLKQFEQHAMLDMAQFYSTANRVVNHCLFAKAADQYQLAFVPETSKSPEGIELPASNIDSHAFSRRLSDAVEVAIVELCDSEKLPAYLSEMFNSQWREVLLLVGSIRGHESSAWNEVVKVAADLVVFTTSENTATMATAELLNMLKGGFNLIRLPQSKQKEFLQNFDHQMQGEIEEIFQELPGSASQVETVLLPQKTSSDSAEEAKSDVKASISAAGRKILDDDDLDDIVALLSGSQEQTKEYVPYKRDDAQSNQDSLTSFLQMVDNLKEGDEVEFVREGEVQKCRIQTPAEKGNSFQVTNNSGQVVLARSRVGLALATKSGELRLGRLATISPHSVSESRTLIDGNTDIEKTAAH